VLGIVKQPGAFREFLTLPERNLRRVPREIPSEEAVFVEPLAAACEILDQVRIPRGAPVAVLGDGKLGAAGQPGFASARRQVHQYGRHKEKLRIAEQSGVSTEIAKKLPVAKYEFVVEATGSSEGLRQAVQMTQPRGTVIMKSTVHGLVASIRRR
jgi:threonine dehydrogenase-like Zn-dependent dehydrogenase